MSYVLRRALRRALAARSATASAPASPPCGAPLYTPRRPQASPLYRVLADHFETLTHVHEERYEPTHGPLRPVVSLIRFRGHILKGGYDGEHGGRRSSRS